MRKEIPNWLVVVVIVAVIVVVVVIYALLMKRPSGPPETPPIGKTPAPSHKAPIKSKP